MNLQERHDACEMLAAGFQDRGLYIQLPSEFELMMAVDGLHDAASSWTGDHLQRPDGSPTDVQSSAEALDDIALDLAALKTTLDTRASQIETAMNADAGRADAVRTRAFTSLAMLESKGIGIISAALKTYASALDVGQTSLDRHAADVETAQSSAMQLAGPDGAAEWTDEQCAAGMQRVLDIYDAAKTALIGCRDAFAAVLAAERPLGPAFGDAAGYARLSDLPPSATTTTADAVLALVDGVGDPDRAVVSDAEWAAYVAARDKLSPQERAQLDAALDGARTPDERQVILSALATGAGLPLTLSLASRLKGMTSDQVSKVAGLGLTGVTDDAAASGAGLFTADGTPIAQKTGTTCGSAALLMLAAQRDPFLALLISNGEFVDGHVPSYVSDVPYIDQLPVIGGTTTDRLTYLQDQIRIQTNRGTFFPGAAFGSAPWGYGSEVSRVLGTDVDMDYDDIGPKSDPQELVDRAVAAVDAGTPVPFLVGGSGRWNLPNHYVLLVGHAGDQLQFYDPGSGEVRTVSMADAVSRGDDPIAAFGNWTSIYGAAIPSS